MKKTKTHKVTQVVCTCNAEPKQWEGMLDNGRLIYVRHQWGELVVSVSPRRTRKMRDAVLDGEIVLETRVPDVDYTILKQLTVGIVEWPERDEPFESKSRMPWK